MYVLIIIYLSLIKIVQAFDSFNMGPRYYRSTGHLSSHRCPQERRGVFCGPALHRVHRSQTAETRVCQPCIDLWLAGRASLPTFPIPRLASIPTPTFTTTTHRLTAPPADDFQTSRTLTRLLCFSRKEWKTKYRYWTTSSRRNGRWVISNQRFRVRFSQDRYVVEWIHIKPITAFLLLKRTVLTVGRCRNFSQ